MQFETNFFVTNDQTTLAYYDFGQGQPIILLADYSYSAKIWFKQIQALHDYRGFRIIALDRREHGQSHKPGFGQSLSRHAYDLHELIQKLNLEKPIVVGLGQGASVFYAYCSLFGEKSIKAAVIVEQPPKMVNELKWKHGYHSLTWSTIHEFIKKEPLHITSNGFPPLVEKVLTQIQTEDPPFSRKDTLALWENYLTSSWVDIMERLTIPILFVAGAKSSFFPAEHVEKMATIVKNGHAHIVSDCGHLVPLEQPEQFNDVLIAFVGQFSAEHLA